MIKLTLNAPWTERVVPVRLAMSEAISNCYHASLDMLSDDEALDFNGAIGLAATITVTFGDAERRITGLVEEMSLQGTLPQGRFWYNLVLVPRANFLQLTSRSRVFCTERPAKVGDIIKTVLATAVGVELKPSEYETSLRQSAYPLRDMVVQYEEPDWVFLSRLAEDAGIFSFFRDTASGEQIVFGDDNGVFPRLVGGANGDVLPYRPSAGLVDPGPAVRSVSLRSAQRWAAADLGSRDYTDPDKKLRVQSRPQPGGLGSRAWQEVDDYTDVEWGQALADIRAQEAAADRIVLTGESDCLTLTAGCSFKLEGHDCPAVNRRYVVTDVGHNIWEYAAGMEFLPGGPHGGSSCHNKFFAIPADVPFRPRRLTPWPRVPGLIRAVIDGSDKQRAEIDDLGRYRIILPFDWEKHPPGKASGPVRLLSPYGGPPDGPDGPRGLHFPLLPGTQVMIAFQHGDPDRPIIVGPLYDADQMSVVTAKNHHRNIIRTPSGITLTINDGPPSG